MCLLWPSHRASTIPDVFPQAEVASHGWRAGEETPGSRVNIRGMVCRPLASAPTGGHAAPRALGYRLRREAGGDRLLHDHRQRAHHLARPYREPPDTAMRSPVTHPVSSETRNSATRALSSGCLRRPSGLCTTICVSRALPMRPIRWRPSVSSWRPRHAWPPPRPATAATGAHARRSCYGVRSYPAARKAAAPPASSASTQGR